jgi:hypothetical protein
MIPDARPVRAAGLLPVALERVARLRTLDAQESHISPDSSRWDYDSVVAKWRRVVMHDKGTYLGETVRTHEATGMIPDARPVRAAGLLPVALERYDSVVAKWRRVVMHDKGMGRIGVGYGNPSQTGDSTP